ncbi:MAG: filamentous hemagglutinin N-terminal domain-containing protein, partial [Nodosilinea sp.]
MKITVFNARVLQVILFLMGGMLLGAGTGQAQGPVSDGSTGTVVDATVPGSEFEITGGTVSGSNLFHSFSQFSVPSLGTVTFLNDDGAIRNVVSRITGNGSSIIDGLITVGGLSPDFNLFLINPNGIIFGPDGKLDINGSFVASTSQSVEFGSQGIFTVSGASSDLSLLTVSPSALLFQQMATAQPLNSIQMNGSVVSVPAGQSLVLLGGNPAPSALATGAVSINDTRLNAQSGRVEIGAVGGPGRVALGNTLELIFPQGLPKADIDLQRSSVDVGDFSGGAGGGVAQLQGRAVGLDDSLILALNDSGLQGGGGIVIRAGRLTLDDSVALAITTSPAAGGNVLLDLRQGPGQLRLLNGSKISAETEGPGPGGSLNIEANDIEVLSDSGLGTETRGNGNAGSVAIDTQTLWLENGLISSNTFGGGNGGQLSIDAAERIDLLGLSEITALADDFNPDTGLFVPGVGAAGSLMLTTGQLNIQGGSQIA